MKTRQIFVNLIIIVAFALLGVFCFYEGKAYDVLVSNTDADQNGQTHPAMEAVQVRILPDGKVIRLYADEALVYEGQIVGPKVHKLEIAPLDLEDKPIAEQTRVVDIRARDIPFVTRRGTRSRVIYVPVLYETGSAAVDHADQKKKK